MILVFEHLSKLASKDYFFWNYLLKRVKPSVLDERIPNTDEPGKRTDYAKKMSLYLDKEYLLPVYVKVYDDKGLYEHFEYVNLKVDPVIKAEEFTKDYKEYDF